MQIPIVTFTDAFLEAQRAAREGKMPHFITFTEETDGRITYSFSQ